MFVRTRQIAVRRDMEKCNLSEDFSHLRIMEESVIEKNKLATLTKEVTKLQIGEYMLVFEPEEADGIYLEKARTELRETPEIVDQAVHDLKLLIEGEPALYVPEDIEFYRKFLRPCKWYPRSAFNLMKRFYRFRVNNPRLCVNLLPSKERNVFASGIFIPLPNRTEDGCRVLLIQIGSKWNPKKIILDEIFKAAMLSLDAAMAEPKTQICGVHVIIDVEGLSLHQVTYFTPSFASLSAEWVQRCLPCRLKGIHVVNQPFIFKMVFAIFKPFLQEKTRRRIYFHGTNYASLLAHIDAKALPTKLGGNVTIQDELLGESIWQYFCTHEDKFKESNLYGYVNNEK